MRRFDPTEYNADEIIEELLRGDGVVVFPQLFPPDAIAEARRIIMDRSSAEPPRVTHFQGTAEIENRLTLQRRVWNLLTKGAVFSSMAEHPVLVDILKRFLGTEFIMGSIAANRILPGGPGQEPHIDYPYWDFHKPESFPIGLNTSFPMNAQVTIVLDPFTDESGATAYVPGSQKDIRYPAEADRFYDRCERMVGEPGDAVLFFGAVWHCAMPNRSDHDRTGVLIEYLPKFVKPVEDMLTTLSDEFRQTMSPMMRQLLGFDYPHPQLFDEAEARSAEGRIRKAG